MQVECGFPIPQNLVDYGPTLFVQIGFDPIYQPNSENNPDLPTTIYPALVDTGATDSCIDSSIRIGSSTARASSSRVTSILTGSSIEDHLLIP